MRSAIELDFNPEACPTLMDLAPSADQGELLAGTSISLPAVAQEVRCRNIGRLVCAAGR